MLERFKEYVNVTRFNAIKISLASPEKIRALSYGEVKKIETINYRTLKPERDGLFCARIFGPQKDWECNCGKYRRMKHRGVTCEKCGVEVIQSRVRRERMGHIELVAPVSHIWYLKGMPSYFGLILDMAVKDIERVIYFDNYIVIRQGRSPYARKVLLTNLEYENYVDSHPEDTEFLAEIGAEAIRLILKELDLALELEHLKTSYGETASVALRHKLIRRIKVISGLLQSKLRPEWMIISVLSVMPPDLRPLVPLEGGRFASSDLNELYRRVLNRNIRLQRLIEIEAPSVIVKNEKRMLQESVDALIDNGRRGQAVRGSNRRPLKSLSEMLRGKQGRFRQNLLGRRVDYSGRSVIVVDPELKLNQCGLPKAIAFEIFKPYVYAGLLQGDFAPNMRVARRLVEEGQPEVWDVLESIVTSRPILLNRAPTLHRLGIQAFYPILVEGKAIKIHPLVCSAFNADFDGDTMCVHLPLSDRAQEESRRLMLSTKNILSPSNGRPVTVPSQDMVLGLHYMTKVRANVEGEGILFASVNEVVRAYQCKQVSLHARIQLRLEDTSIVSTTVGRALLFEALPKGSRFHWVNKVVGKSDLAKLIEKIYYHLGSEETILCLDRIKKLGFYNATMSGISFVLSDLVIPEEKKGILIQAELLVKKTEKLYMDGVITNGERYNKVLSVWGQATADVASAMYKDLEVSNTNVFMNADKSNKPFNSIFMMLESGAKGTRDQAKQLAGMRGPMVKPTGEIMEMPVKSNFKEGLRVYEYFTSTHGARKGQADTALKTANSGYLTRRLVDVAQDVVVITEDCKTLGYVELADLKDSGDIVYALANRVFGRVLAADVKDPVNGEIIGRQNDIVDRNMRSRIAESIVETILVRSVLTCQAKFGVCVKCYGYDLSKSAYVDIGTTVGIIAAQSIGEPGTQLTMRTFHIGGTASGLGDQPYYEAKFSGIAEWRGIRTITNHNNQLVVMSRKAKLVILAEDNRELQRFDLEYGSVIYVQDKQPITVGTKLVEWDPHNKVILTERPGTVKFIDLIEGITVQERFDEVTNKSSFILLEARNEKYQPAISIVDADGEELVHYYLPSGSFLNVVNNQKINIGDVMVKMPREVSRSKDITVGGLPRIAELFEARSPRNPAIISDIDGDVVIGGLHRGMRKISVVNGAETFDYLIPRGKQINVVNGERVNAGDRITSGSPVLHDMLRIMGLDVVQRYLVDHIQEIYRLQGIDISDRHIELIIRQMVRKVRVVDPGNSTFAIGDKIDRIHFRLINSTLKAEGKKAATAKPILMGVTQASLGTESPFSAASFQETTRILAEAATMGQIDYLYGLKENVIIGKVIPAGTGIRSFREKYLGDDLTELEREAAKAEEQDRNRVVNTDNVRS